VNQQKKRLMNFKVLLANKILGYLKMIIFPILLIMVVIWEMYLLNLAWRIRKAFHLKMQKILKN